VPLRTATDTDDDAAVAAAAGADLTLDLPALAAWLRAVDGPLTLANHAYADGSAHVRVAVAADALLAHLASTGQVTATAFLATPTDVFAAPRTPWRRPGAATPRAGG
jgi:ADP-heptose:LPS heptosyltransferase